MAYPGFTPHAPAAGTLLVAALTRRRGTATDDLMIRVTGGLAALGLAAAFVVPAVAQLAPFVLYTIWTNGPHSPVMNGGYEPVLMLYGRFFPPLLIGIVGTLATVFVEWIDYHIYARVGDSGLGRKIRASRWLTRLTDWYRRQPFAVIVFCALGPVPFWVARGLSAVTRYSMPRYLTGVAVGRFPRLWLIAALGQPLGVPTSWLLGITLASLGLGAATWAAARWRSRRRPAARAGAPATPGGYAGSQAVTHPTITSGVLSGTPASA